MDKKCSICNEKCTDYGNRYLRDGIVCRNCVKFASPWLSDDDYKRRDIEDFKEHLKYRELNKEKLESFEPENVVKGKYTLYLDKDNRQFVISKRKDYKKDNADVLNYDDIQKLTIYDSKDDTGNYNIYVNIDLNFEEIDNVCFRVNEFPGLERDSDEYNDALKKAYEYLGALEDEEGKDFEEVDNG